MRYLAAAIADWPKMMRQAFENTKPGGWAEFEDFDLAYYSEDGSLKEEQHISKWITTLLDAAQEFGRDPCPGSKLEGWMKDAGFEAVQHEKFRLPIGPWPKNMHLVCPAPEHADSKPSVKTVQLTHDQKTIGAWNLVQVEDGLEAFTLRLFTQFLGWKTEEVQVLLANVRKDLRDPKIHAQFDL